VSIENAHPRAEAQIRALIDAWASAMRAKDVEGVMAHYARDCATFDLAPPLISTGSGCGGPAGVVRDLAGADRLRDPRPEERGGRGRGVLPQPRPAERNQD
jgi:hypothetical protein